MYIRFPSLINDTGASGVSYDSDAQAYFTAATITDNNEKNAWNTFVNSAKSSGYYNKFYFFYPFLGSDPNKTKYNAINTSLYTITWTGSVTHNSVGVEATAINSTASTGFNPDGNFYYNDAHIGYYLDINSLDSAISIDIPMLETNAICGIYLQYNGTLWGRANMMNSISGVVYAANTSGLYAINTEYNTGASEWEYKAYTNGSVTETFQGTGSEDATGATGLNLFYYYVSAYYSLANLRCAYAAQGFTASEMTDFNTHLQTFMTALGRNL